MSSNTGPRHPRLEDQERLLLTPFEKNLQVWRQLWRVVERSHVVCQVLDARNPTFYWSDDLAGFARETHAAKPSVAILNKADLVPRDARAAWAKYFAAKHVPFLFWSAELAKPGRSTTDDVRGGGSADSGNNGGALSYPKADATNGFSSMQPTQGSGAQTALDGSGRDPLAVLSAAELVAELRMLVSDAAS